MPLFFPPTGTESSDDFFFGRYRVQVGYSVVKKDGHYVTVPYVWMGELLGDDGADYFLGGREYTVTDDIAADLVADGFTTYEAETPPGDDDPNAFGEGGFGEGKFGQ